MVDDAKRSGAAEARGGFGGRQPPNDVDGGESSIGARGSRSLASAAIGARVRIVAARLDEDVAAWLAAVGLHEGEEVTVLRRAVFGGPLHVRTAAGGEFAVAKELAARLDVTLASESSP